LLLDLGLGDKKLREIATISRLCSTSPKLSFVSDERLQYLRQLKDLFTFKDLGAKGDEKKTATESSMKA
jgi:hypothetical protein